MAMVNYPNMELVGDRRSGRIDRRIGRTEGFGKEAHLVNQATTFLHKFNWVAWAVLGMSVFAWAVVSPGPWLVEMYDARNPVLKLDAKVVLATADSVVISATGDKVRSCQYVRLQAYGVDTNGVLYDASIERIDQFEDKDSKPVGSFNFGTWRIWPRGNSVRVQIFSQYLCGQRMVVQRILDLKVPT
jgi:hypothetical protein